jgi:hypothetical protein
MGRHPFPGGSGVGFGNRPRLGGSPACWAPAQVGELGLGFGQSFFRLGQSRLGLLGLFPGAAGDELDFFAPALGQPRSLPGLLELAFGNGQLFAGELNVAG